MVGGVYGAYQGSLHHEIIQRPQIRGPGRNIPWLQPLLTITLPCVCTLHLARGRGTGATGAVGEKLQRLQGTSLNPMGPVATRIPASDFWGGSRGGAQGVPWSEPATTAARVWRRSWSTLPAQAFLARVLAASQWPGFTSHPLFFFLACRLLSCRAASRPCRPSSDL